MEYRLGETAPFQPVPGPGGRPLVPVAVGPSDTKVHLVEVQVPGRGRLDGRGIIGGAPWLRVRQNGRGTFRLLIRPAEAGGAGQYLTVIELGGQALGLLLQVDAPAPAALGGDARPARRTDESAAAPALGPLPPSPDLSSQNQRASGRRLPVARVGLALALALCLVGLVILAGFLAAINRPPPTDGQLRVLCTWDPSFPAPETWPPATLRVRHTVAGASKERDLPLQALRSGRGTPRAFVVVEEVPLGAGQVEVACSQDHPDLCSRPVSFDLGTARRPFLGPPVQELQVLVQPAPSLTVRTRPGARIRLTGEGGSVAERRADGDGRCELKGLLRPDRSYTLTAACPPDFGEAKGSLSIRAGSNPGLDLPLKRVAGTLEYRVAWDNRFPRPSPWPPPELVLKGKLDGRIVILSLKAAEGKLPHVPFGKGSLEVVRPADLCSDRVQVLLDARQPVRRLGVTVRPAPRLIVTAEPSEALVKVFAANVGLLGKGQGRCELVLRPGQPFTAQASCAGYIEAKRAGQAEARENRIHLPLQRPYVASGARPASGGEDERFDRGCAARQPPAGGTVSKGRGVESHVQTRSIWDKSSGEGLH